MIRTLIPSAIIRRCRMAERKWWPADWADEWMPPSRSSPDGFIQNVEGDPYLGYPLHDPCVTECEKRQFNQRIAVGDIVQFLCCDDLGSVSIELRADGSYRADAPFDSTATSFWIAGDNDTLADSMDEFARLYVESDHSGGVPQRLDVRLARWSDPIPHKLVVKLADNKHGFGFGFEQVTDAEARQ